jgi:predicted CXXCH cytochrome family protein
MRLRKWSKRSIVIALLGVVVVLGLGGAIGGTILEERDDFCITCHTKPESTYYDRTRQALKDATAAADLQNLIKQRVAIDLAGQHYIVTGTMSCIACHGGTRNVGDRIESLALGAKDSVVYFLGRADQTIEKATTGDPALIDRACVACHIAQLVTITFDNHFHVKLPQTWNLLQSGVQPIVPADTPNALTNARTKPELLETSLTCLSCHQAHRSNLDFTQYLDQNAVVLPACAKCHDETGKGPTGIAPQ